MGLASCEVAVKMIRGVQLVQHRRPGATHSMTALSVQVGFHLMPVATNAAWRKDSPVMQGQSVSWQPISRHPKLPSGDSCTMSAVQPAWSSSA